MPHFGSYNTDDATTGNTPLIANASLIVGPIQSGIASKIVGSVWADQPGTLFVEQSFDGTNFDAAITVAVTASTGASIDQDVIAPVFRLRYVNGATNQGRFRLFARTLTAGRG